MVEKLANEEFIERLCLVGNSLIIHCSLCGTTEKTWREGTVAQFIGDLKAKGWGLSIRNYLNRQGIARRICCKECLAAEDEYLQFGS